MPDSTKNRTISAYQGRKNHHWLNQKIVISQEKKYCTILTNDEEECVLTFLKNKNRCILAVNMKELEKIII